jgi:hypothetical protein
VIIVAWVATLVLVLLGIAALSARIVEEHDEYFTETTEADVLEGVLELRHVGDWIDDRVEAVKAEYRQVGIATGDTLYTGRHRLGEAEGSTAQVARWTSPTGAFERITASVFDTGEMHGLAELVAAWMCWHCQISDHAACPGCTCEHEMAVS